MGERNRVIEVHRLAFGLGSIGINQHDFCCEPTEEQSVSKSCSHIPDSYHRNARRTMILWDISQGNSSAFIYFPVAFTVITELQEPVLWIMPFAALRTLQISTPACTLAIILF